MATLSFILFCVGIGISLSIDVFFVTLMKLREKKSLLVWALWVAFLHTLFPDVTFTLGWSIEQLGHWPTIAVNLIGGSLVYIFLYEEFCEKTNRTPIIAPIENLKELLGVSRETAGMLVLGTGVSIDSALFGLTFVATKATEGWSLTETYVAIGIAGLTVFLVTFLTPHLFRALAYMAKKLGMSMQEEVAESHFWADLMVFSVIGGFGALAYANVVFNDASILYSMLASTVFWSLLFYRFRAELMAGECEDAEKVLSK